MEVATQAAGWWRSPSGNLSADAAVRPPAEARPEKATALRTDFADGEVRLCIEADANILMAADGTLSSAPDCRDWRGRDRIWTWFVAPTDVAAEGVALNGIAMQKRLQDGRFDDLFVTAAPMIDTSDSERRTVAPTRAGALVLGDRGPDGIYASASPGFLARDTADAPVLLTATGAVDLAGTADARCSALADMAGRLPPEATVLRAARIDPGSAQVTILDGHQRLQFLVNCDALSDTLAWALPVTVRDRPRYRALGANALGPRLLASMDRGRVNVVDTNGLGVALPLPDSTRPVSLIAAPDGRAVLIATAGGLYRTDIDRVLSEIAESGIRTDAPAGPFVQPANVASVPPAAATPVEKADETSGPPMPRPDPPRVSKPPLDNTVPVTLTRQQLENVQNVLQAEGHYHGLVDGYTGPRTRAAIRSWQSEHGFETTGALTKLQLDQVLGLQ